MARADDLTPDRSQFEPGLDLHEWETQWQQFQDVAHDDPAQALPQMTDFVETVAHQTGFDRDGGVPGSGLSDELTARLRWAREVGDLVDAGEEPDPGDVADALNGLREVYESLVTNLRS